VAAFPRDLRLVPKKGRRLDFYLPFFVFGVQGDFFRMIVLFHHNDLDLFDPHNFFLLSVSSPQTNLWRTLFVQSSYSLFLVLISQTGEPLPRSWISTSTASPDGKVLIGDGFFRQRPLSTESLPCELSSAQYPHFESGKVYACPFNEYPPASPVLFFRFFLTVLARSLSISHTFTPLP